MSEYKYWKTIKMDILSSSNKKLSEIIQSTLHYPDTVLESQKFSQTELNSSIILLRSVFKDKKLKIDIDNPNYGQLIKLVSLACRNSENKRIIKTLVERLKGIKSGYNEEDNLLFSCFSTKLAYTEFLQNKLPEIIYPEVNFNTLADDEKKLMMERVETAGIYLIECRALIYLIFRDMKKMTEWNKLELDYSQTMLMILNTFNLIDKINAIFIMRYKRKLITKNFEELKLLRNSIAHAHLAIISKDKKNDIIEYIKCKYSENKIEKVELFKKRPTETMHDLLLLTTILNQILCTYQLIFQTKLIREGKLKTNRKLAELNL